MDRMSSLEACTDERERIAKKYDAQRLACRKELSTAKQLARKWRDEKERDWRVRFTAQQYETVAPTLDEILQSRVEIAEKICLDKISAIEQEHQREIDRHDNSRHPSGKFQPKDDQSAALKSPAPTEPPDSRGSSILDFSNTKSSDTQWTADQAGYKLVQSEGSMIATFPTKKRKVNQDHSRNPKQPRIEISSTSEESALRTPMSTPQSGSKPLTNRTTTFHAVSNDKNRDTIIEYPPGCGNFYILFCQEHKIHFTREPTRGAAKHVNGQAHGFLPRNHEIAVREVGYHIIDCNETLMRQHNQAVDKAYQDGYKPINLFAQTKNLRRPHPQPPPKSSRQSTVPSTEKSPPSQNISSRGVTDPKPYHLYCAYWAETRHKYPVMILGWDNLKEGGLNNTLADTKLADPSSDPPKCYLYDQGKIIGWAPGFEDGGSKVRSRQFPVMWFDGVNSWGWVKGRHLTEFSSYSPPKKLKKYFDEARHWISETRKNGYGHRQRMAPKTIKRGTNGEMSPVADMDHSPHAELKRNEPADRQEMEETAAGLPVHGAYDSELEDPELRRLVAKGGDASSDENYDSENSVLDESHSTYRKSFLSLRSHSHSGLTARQEPPADALSRTSSSEGPPSVIDHTLEGRMRQARALSQEVHSGDSIPQETPLMTSGKEVVVSPRGNLAELLRNPQRILSSQQGHTRHGSSSSLHVEVERPPTASPRPHDSQHHDDPNILSGPAPFEISQYTSGALGWKKPKPGDPCIRLFYSIDMKSVLSQGDAIDIRVDTTQLLNFARETGEDRNGNGVVKLNFKDVAKHQMKLVFDRNEGSDTDIGRKQALKFVAWLRSCGIRPAD